MSGARIVCVGIAVFDRVYEMPVLPLTPGKHIAQGYRETGGGMAVTAAVAAAALGGRAAWCGRLGADSTGIALRATIERHGVDCAGVTMAEGGKTPTSSITVDAQGERVLVVFHGQGMPEDAPVPDAVLAGAQAVLADPRWITGAERVFAYARAQGLPRVLDADIAPGAVLHRLALGADHIVFSQLGLLEFSGTDDPQAGLAIAAARLTGTLAVTLGASGSLWWRDGRPRCLPAPRILARDTTGCGDVFHGAYALALAEGAPVEQAARFATAAGALKAGRGNGWDGMPDRAAVEALLREDW